jgi:hypothetical protein
MSKDQVRVQTDKNSKACTHYFRPSVWAAGIWLIAWCLLLVGRLPAMQDSKPGTDTGVAPQLNARDAFWSADDLVGVQPNPAAKTPATKKTPAKKPTTTSRKGTTGSSGVAPDEVAAMGYGARPQLVRTANKMLGLRYTMLKEDADGNFSEVLPSTVFHNGDHIRVSVMSNEPGYLYIAEQGTSGEWKTLFPKEGVDNHIDAGYVYQVPKQESKSFEFHGQSGTEHLFLLLARKPISDPEAILKRAHDESQPAGAGDTPQYAKNTMPDMGQPMLRSRDLVETQVDEPAQTAAKSQQSGEKAVYVVNKASSADGSAIVFADLPLAHQ